MPTDKFEELLKSIRVPIWLEKNTTFYVNSETGSDDNDGTSASSAFKTLDYAYQYITNNYNLTSYNVYIQLAEGTYDVTNTFGGYSCTTGRIYIQGNSSDNTKVVLTKNTPKGTNILMDVDLSGAEIYFRYLTFEFRLSNAQSIESSSSFLRVFLVNGNSSVRLVQCNFVLYVDYALGLNYQLLCTGSTQSNIYLQAPCNITLITSEDITYSKTADFAYNYGYFELTNVSSSNYSAGNNTVTVENGKFSRFMVLNGGSFYRSTTRPAVFASDENCTGQRYYAYNGGTCATNGGGDEFFPGDQAGYIQESTHCWYN